MSDAPIDYEALVAGMFDDDDRAFFEMVNTEDDIGLILRVHLHCARILERMLLETVTVPNPADFKAANLRFQPTVHVLSALGLIDPDTRSRMIWLDNLRNDLAHPASKDRLSQEDFERLEIALGPEGRIVVAEVNTHEKNPTPGNLIRNALYIVRNNLKYLAKHGVDKSLEVARQRLESHRRSMNFDERRRNPD